MGSIMSWVRATGGWVRSPYGDLPMLRVDDTPVHQTWLILAGGLGLVLSRASRAELEGRYAAARQIYAIVYARLNKRRLPKPDPALLRDALQEIANIADPMTREAGRECLARCVERVAAKGRGGDLPSTSAAPLTSSQVTPPVSTHAAPSTQAATLVPPPEDHQVTQLDLDLLFERSNKLRGTVAFARSTINGADS